MRPFLLVLLLIANSVCFCQNKRIAHWYFGHEAGVDFSSGTATADLNGKLASIEGCSAMSDQSGNLLFYSNGEKVWNRNHTLMPNGGITGDQSSTQSSLAVPLPGNNNVYYLFSSVGNGGNSGLYYNIVDMTLNGGLGDVTASKNIQLMADGTEQLAGTIHCNTIDYWIVGRQRKADTLRFYAWLLTKNGVNTPVISDFNVPTSFLNAVGTLTFSQDGRLMAFSSFGTDSYMFDFDIRSGNLSMKYKIDSRPNELMYSNAFSPDGKKLYTTSAINGGFNYLSQFNLTAPDITASRINLDSIDFRFGSPNGFPFIGQIRLAPDQQVYVSRWNQEHPYQVNPHTYYSLDSLDVIHAPNLLGLACGHQRNFLFLNHHPTILGLPIFISNYTALSPQATSCLFDPRALDFTFSGECSGQATQFSYSMPPEISSVQWDFGDPASGANNTSTEVSPSHLYTQPGEYTPKLTVFYYSEPHTLQKNVTVSKTRCTLYMPTAFSPNGKGLNNQFRPVYGDNTTRFKMRIFNRWGQLIFESADHKNGWDGIYRGQPQPQGVYVWSVEYDTPLLKNQVQKGTLVLIR